MNRQSPHYLLEYSPVIPSFVPDDQREFYYQNAGIYDNPELLDFDTIYARFYRINENELEWGTGFSYGKYYTSLSYDENSNDFLYSDVLTASNENSGIITASHVLSNGPSIENPIYLDIYQKKISDNELMWDEFDHVALDQESLVDFVEDFLVDYY